jgi:hypothetical protein
MALDTIGQLPGKKDINDQFTVGANIHKALECFKRIQNNGTYEFGALTACFYNLPPGEDQSWMNEVKIYPADAQDQIKNCIIKALTNQKDGRDDPIPITMIWSGGSPNEVKCTYNPSPRSYTIEIIGYPPPMAAALAERRAKKKK